MQLILTHNFSDFDALASQVAAARLYQGAQVLLSAQLNDNVAEYVGLHRDELALLRRADLPAEPAIERLILVDTGHVQGQLRPAPGTPLVIIDHHPFEREPEPWEQLIVEQVGATTTILVQRLREGDLALSPAEATLLLLGIYEDTGSLSFKGTTATDLSCAAWLLERGADIGAVAQYLHRPLSPEQERAYQQLLQTLRFEEVGGWQMLLGSVELESHVPELAALAHRLREIYEPAALLLCFGIAGNGAQLIARSNGEAVDVGAITQRFGGGGHPTAAAAFVRERSAAELLGQVENAMRALVRPVLTAAEIMSAPPQSLSVEASMAEAAARLDRTGYASLPVVDARGAPVGLIGRRELDKALRHGLNDAAVRTYMWKGISTVAPETPAGELRRLMVAEERGRLLVTVEGRLAGVISRGDLLRETERSWAGAASGELAGLIAQALPAPLAALLRRTGELAAQRGWPVYLVGGPVRDLLLGRPVHDLDLVVEGEAITLAQAVAEEYGALLHSHEQFGTSTVSFAQGELAGRHLDFVTARIEFYEHPTALPQVEAASLRHDLHRRDFTINTLALGLHGSHFGQLYDFYGGQRDLQRRLIRVLHNLSFIDDPTRILRAARLAARLEFSVEPRTRALIADALEHGVLGRTTPDRIRHELRRTLEEPEPERAVRLLDELGILRALHPGLAWSEALNERLRRARDEGLELPLSYLLLLTYDLPPDERAALAARYHMTARQRLLLHELDLAQAALPSLRQQPLGDGWLDQLLHGRDLLALRAVALAEQGLAGERIGRYLAELRPVATLLSGRDLQAAGLSPGPRFGPLLSELRRAQLDGEVAGREAALEWVRRLAATTSAG